MSLDNVDWEIIKHLQLNGRKSFKELGEAVGFTGLGAKKRVEKLQKQKVIHFSTLINTEKLDLRLALILLEMENTEAMRNTIDRYRECPRIINLFTTLGGYNLVVLVMAESQDTLECEAMEQCSLRSSEGIRRSEFYPIGKIHYSPYLYIRSVASDRNNLTPCGVDCRDCEGFQIQKCLGCPSASYYRGPLQMITEKAYTK
jgi:Lrp/AsnC family transcriptional regulator for asnA, asnC and gidA